MTNSQFTQSHIDTLTQPEMQRLYERGCPATFVLGDEIVRWFIPAYLTPTALMLGACHDLAVELGNKPRGIIDYALESPHYSSDLESLVALWHKMKDEQLEQKPSEPEKVNQDLLNLALSASNAAAHPIKTETEAKIDYALFRVEGCVDREEFTALQSDVAKLAEFIQVHVKHLVDRVELHHIITRNRKES